MAESPSDRLHVKLHQIGDEGLTLDLTVSKAQLQDIMGAGTQGFVAHGSSRLQVNLYLVDRVVHVRGQLHAELAVGCARCSVPITISIRPRFEYAMFPEGREPEAREDGEVAEQDMEVTVYRGDEINLATALRDEVFLSLPMFPDCTAAVGGRCAEYDAKGISGTAAGNEPAGKLYEALKGIKIKTS